jgi:hypothetical protein
VQTERVKGRNSEDFSAARGDSEPNAVSYAMNYSRSHDALIRVYDAAGNVIETHKHAGDFKAVILLAHGSSFFLFDNREGIRVR